MLTSILILLLLGFVAFKILWRSHSSDVLSKLPAPKGWPVFGHLFLMDNEKPHLTFTAWANQCGGIYAIRLLGEKIVVVSSLETLHEALLQKGKDFGGRSKRYYRYNIMSEGYQSLLCASMGPVWSYLRKTVHTELKLYDAGTGKERFEQVTGEILNELVEDIAIKKGSPFNPRELLQNSMLNVIIALLVGIKYSREDEEFHMLARMDELIRSVLTVGGNGALLDAFPWLRYFGNQTYKDFMKFIELRSNLYEKLKKKIQDDFANGEYSNGIAHVFFKDYEDQINKKGVDQLSETWIKLAMVELLQGGSVTTISVLTAFINFMVHHPEVQKALRQEICHVVGTERRCNLADRTRMPYTKAVILELNRITTVLPMGVPHDAMVDSSIAGYAIPKGTQVFTNLWALHHDEGFWGDPNVFRPERYLDGTSGDLLPADHPVRKHTLPFGTGARMCIGESLAMHRLFLVVSTLVQRFSIEADHAKPLVPCDPESFIMGAVLTPQPYTVRMVPLF